MRFTGRLQAAMMVCARNSATWSVCKLMVMMDHTIAIGGASDRVSVGAHTTQGS